MACNSEKPTGKKDGTCGHFIVWEKISDEELMDRMGQGDHYSFAILYNRHWRYARWLARRFTRNETIAQDIAQDVFLHIWKAANRYRPRARFRTWLYKIVLNRCINHSQRNKWITNQEDFIARHREFSNWQDTSSPLGRMEDHARVKRLLSHLHKIDRLILFEHYVNGIPYAQIAITLGMNEKTVRDRAYHARRKLREILGNG